MRPGLLAVLPALIGQLLVAESSGIKPSEILPVWPGAVPADSGTIGPERVRAPAEAPTTTAKWITNVSRPTLSLFRPAADKDTGTAVVICPGGGYWNLAWDLEGEEVAARLNALGITGLVLKYRVPRRPGEPERLPAPGPLLDAQRAISLVRSRAADWGIDPNRVGIAGFSAGGHLALATATRFHQRAYEPLDGVDQWSCRPDFVVAVYPGYLIEQNPAGVEINTNTLAPYLQIPADTPPVFLVHASDDRVAGPENSMVLYQALRQAGVSAELHVYAQGGHGFGVRESGQPCSTWIDRFAAWLSCLGLLGTKHAASALPELPDLPEGNRGIAARYPDDAGIAADPSVLFHDDFEAGDPWSRWDNVFHRSNLLVTEVPEHVHRGRRSLEFRVPRQETEVANAVIKRLVLLRNHAPSQHGWPTGWPDCLLGRRTIDRGLSQPPVPGGGDLEDQLRRPGPAHQKQPDSREPQRVRRRRHRHLVHRPHHPHPLTLRPPPCSVARS